MKKDKNTKTETKTKEIETENKKNETDTKKNETKNTKTKDEKPKQIDKSLIILLIIILILLVFSINIISNKIQYDATMRECKEIENHESLSIPCNCYPYTKPEDISEIIKKNTNQFCRCLCEIGENQTKYFDILRAK
ncbi:MAG: hypothetical protein K0B02_00205 [DPANN group archaeon]|nr:hypothetical protein [DPANN group archaeon]